MGRSRLAGLCYIADRWHLHRKKRITYEVGIDAMVELGVRHWRNWMHTGSLLVTPTQIQTKHCTLQHEMIAYAQRFDIEVVGMNHDWFADGDYSRSVTCVPEPGTEGYMRTMKDYQQSWHTISAEFPEINVWEVGNEWNHSIFLKPCDGGEFTLQQKAEISVDMLRHARMGIRLGNPHAVVVMGGPASLKEPMSDSAKGIKSYYQMIFEACQKQGISYESCFDIANWHPYFTPGDSWEAAVADWIEANHDIFQHLKQLGYQRDFVWMTEFGFSDVTPPPERLHEPGMDVVNAAKLGDCLEAIRSQMPFVQVLHYFRLFDDLEDIEWSRSNGHGEMEGYFGLYKENIVMKEKGKVYKQFAEGL